MSDAGMVTDHIAAGSSAADSPSPADGYVGDPAVQEEWDRRYAEQERMWSGQPNGALVAEVAGLTPARVLDVGCGEGVLVQRWARALPGARVVGIDLEEESIQAGWAEHAAPNLEYRVMEAANLPFGENEFDLASAIEVLEHVPDPEHTIAEMARCAERHLLVSVPREPLWRMLNMARGAYWSELGNTPGHLNHWSRRSFVQLLSRHGEVAQVRSPFPWTMLLVRL